jgi:DNA-binding CsgD family transcriptional regulator
MVRSSFLRSLTKSELIGLLNVVRLCSTAQTQKDLVEVFSLLLKVVPCSGAIPLFFRFDQFNGKRVTAHTGENPMGLLSPVQKQSTLSNFIPPTYPPQANPSMLKIENRHAEASMKRRFSLDTLPEWTFLQSLMINLDASDRRENEEHRRHLAALRFLLPSLRAVLARFIPSTEKVFLSDREQEVLKWMKEGKTNWEISQILQISERTVKFHIRNIFKKLGASRRSQAVALAIQRRLVD